MYYRRSSWNECHTILAVILPLFIGGGFMSTQDRADPMYWFGCFLVGLGIFLAIIAIPVSVHQQRKKGRYQFKAVTKSKPTSNNQGPSNAAWTSARKYLASLSNKREYLRMHMTEIAELVPLRKKLGIKNDPTLHVAFTMAFKEGRVVSWEEIKPLLYEDFLRPSYLMTMQLHVYKDAGKRCSACGALAEDSMDAYCGNCGKKF